MRHLAVFSQAFPVVARHHNESTGGQTSLVNPSKQAAHLLIHVSNFTRVEIRCISALVRFRRVVGSVRVIIMSP